MCAKHYENPTMLSKVTAKMSRMFFWDTLYVQKKAFALPTRVSDFRYFVSFSNDSALKAKLAKFATFYSVKIKRGMGDVLVNFTSLPYYQIFDGTPLGRLGD